VEFATHQVSACLAISTAGAPTAPGGVFGLLSIDFGRRRMSAVDEIDDPVPEIRKRSR
jgi:hypothetical protein